MSTLHEIQQTINTDIDPIIKLHQGSCKAVSFHDGVLGLELQGGCVGCPSSKITLFNGILPILQEKHPDILDVFLA